MPQSRDLSLIEKNLVDFTREYHKALEAALEIKGRDTFPEHGEKTEYISIFKANDGFVTFYQPAVQKPFTQKGYYFYDYSKYSLNAICQSLFDHRLQVSSPLIGQTWHEFEQEKDVEIIPDIKVSWFREDVRQAIISGTLTSLPGMTISPIIKIENGIRKAVEPARVKVWSPTFDFSGVGVRRLYRWTHADFWWFPEKLNVVLSNAHNIATYDLLAFETVLSSAPSFVPRIAQQDTSKHAADILERYCEEFLTLLSKDGHREEKLHQWLNKTCHHIFLDPYATEVWNKLPFGNKVSDFVVRRSDQTYVLIEIEKATDRIFRQDNSEPSANFNHACQQVLDWQRYVRDNAYTVRNELGLKDIYEPDGMVVMGRSADIDTDEAQLRWRDMKNKYAPQLYTYDELCERVRILAMSLRSILKMESD